MFPLPFKLTQAGRHHIPRQKRKVTNWPAYDASLRQRGSLTVWVTDEAIRAWRAEPRTTRGGQPWYSELAILTALTLRAVFRLAYRQTEGLIGSVIRLLGLDLPCPGPHHPEPPGSHPGGAPATVGQRRCRARCRARASAGGQHRAEAVWARRVAGREARFLQAPVLAEIAPRCGCRHGPDRRRSADGPRGGRR